MIQGHIYNYYRSRCGWHCHIHLKKEKNNKSIPKFGLDKCREWHQVQDQIERQHSPEEGEGEAEVRPQIKVLAIEIKAVLREVVSLEQVVRSVPVSAPVLGVVIGTDWGGVDGEIRQFVEEGLFVQDGGDIAVHDHVT